MRSLFLLPCLLFSLAAKADFVSVEADHANFLYSEGEKATLLLHLNAVPRPGLTVEAHVTFPGMEKEIVEFESDNTVYQTPVLTAGEKNVGIEVRLIDRERRAADLEAIATTQEQIAYWTARLEGETNPSLIQLIQERIAVLEAQLAALEADLARTDEIVQSLLIQIQVNSIQ